MGVVEINLYSLGKHFSDEDAAYKLVEEMRWPNGPEVPLSKWLLAIYLINASKNGVAAYELHRTLGVTNTTAWFMLHRLRAAMDAGPMADMFRGTVVADETFMGGKPKNRHQQGKARPGTSKGHAGRADQKVPVLTLVNRTTGQARSRVIPDVTGATLQKAIAEQVDVAGSSLQTDGWMGYRQLGREFQAHDFVDHSSHEYVRNGVHTNDAENFFSQLKRSIDGTQHHVSRVHLPRYLAEFDFRYSTKEMSDTARMRKFMGRTGGKRLTYRATVS